MDNFVQKTSIARKLSVAIVAVSFMFLAGLVAIYVSGRFLLTGLSGLHETERFSRTLTELREITDTLSDSLGKPQSEVRPVQDYQKLFNTVYSEAASKVQESEELSHGDPEYDVYLEQMKDSFHNLYLTAQRYFPSEKPSDRERELFLGKQYALEASEAEEKLSLVIERRGDSIFEHIYRARFRPFFVAFFLTFLFIALAVVGGFVFTRKMRDSIKALVDATREVTGGNFNIQAAVGSRDEIGTLAHAFNAMTRALHQSTVSNEYVETIIQSLPDPMFVLGRDGRIQRSNRAASESLGFRAEDFKGRLLLKYLGKVEPAMGERFMALLNGETLRDWETTLLTSSGKILPALLSASAITNKDGVAIGFVSVVKDISDRKEVEAERKTAENARHILAEATVVFSQSIDYKVTLRNVVQAIVPGMGDVGIVKIVGKGGLIVNFDYASTDPKKGALIHDFLCGRAWDTKDVPVLSRVMSSGKSEVFSDSFSDAIHPTSDSQVKLMQKLGIHSYIVCPMLYGGAPIGTLTLASSSPTRRYGPMDLPLVEEIARRAAIALENAGLYHEAQEAISTRDEFLSIASHELKTPLTSLSLQIQTLNRGLHKSLEAQRTTGAYEKNEPLSIPRKTAAMVSTCEDQVSKLTTLLDELLDLTRIRLGKLQLNKENVELSMVVREVIDRFSMEAAHKGIMISAPVAEPIMGYWDPLRVEQVVMNLISNAIKYGNGKPVSVKVEKNELEGIAILSVKDEGMGIDPQMKERIFERFERAGVTGKKISGLGLGLYILRQIVEAHGGSVQVESELGKGSEFTVKLPLYYDQPALTHETALDQSVKKSAAS